MKERIILTGIVSTLTILTLLTGCQEGGKPESATVSIAPPQLEGARFQIAILAEFPDNLAYGGMRRIYEITDTQTHRTYLSITGMGLDRMRADEDAKDAAEAATDAAFSALDSFEE